MSNIQAETITLNGIQYVRADSVKPATIGDKRIIVADRGWVFLGDCEDMPDGSVTIRNAVNIRKWGTTKGLGQLCTGPTSETIADPAGTVQCSPIVQYSVVGGW
jgi:hypothetical protein